MLRKCNKITASVSNCSLTAHGFNDKTIAVIGYNIDDNNKIITALGTGNNDIVLAFSDFEDPSVTTWQDMKDWFTTNFAACVGSSLGGTPTTGDSTAANQQLIIQELQNLITLLTPNTETVVEVIHLNTVGVYNKADIIALSNNAVSEIHSISVSSYTGNPIFEHPIGQTPSTIKQSGNRLISGDTRLNNVEPIDGDFELTIAAGDEALLVVTFIK